MALKRHAGEMMGDRFARPPSGTQCRSGSSVLSNTLRRPGISGSPENWDPCSTFARSASLPIREGDRIHPELLPRFQRRGLLIGGTKRRTAGVMEKPTSLVSVAMSGSIHQEHVCGRCCRFRPQKRQVSFGLNHMAQLPAAQGEVPFEGLGGEGRLRLRRKCGGGDCG